MKAASQLLVDISMQRGLSAYDCHSPTRKRCLKNTIRTAKANQIWDIYWKNQQRPESVHIAGIGNELLCVMHHMQELVKLILIAFIRISRGKKIRRHIYFEFNWAVVHPQHNRMKPAHWISLNLLEKIVSKMIKPRQLKNWWEYKTDNIWISRTTIHWKLWNPIWMNKQPTFSSV